jgi:hypothetical protein
MILLQETVSMPSPSETMSLPNLMRMDKEISIALRNKAEYLAAIGIMSSIDLMAQEYYLNRKFISDAHLQSPTTLEEEIELKKLWKKFGSRRLDPAIVPKANQGVRNYFLWSLEHWKIQGVALSEDKRIFLYDFRNEMLHSLDPGEIFFKSYDEGENDWQNESNIVGGMFDIKKGIVGLSLFHLHKYFHFVLMTYIMPSYFPNATGQPNEPSWVTLMRMARPMSGEVEEE